MRTTPEENTLMGEWIAGKLNQMTGPVRFLIPEGGVSSLDAPGQAFHDPEADKALFDSLYNSFQQTSQRKLLRVPAHINDQDFAEALVNALNEINPIEKGLRNAFIERKFLNEKFHDMKKRGIPLVGGGAGTGLSAKCEEEGGIDLIVIYNSGRYRMAGRGSLSGLMAYGNANEIVLEMAQEVLPVVNHTPVLAGVNGTDPFCIFDNYLDQIKTLGFSGVQNFPTVGLIDGNFRSNLEETGMSYGLEIDLIRLAHQKNFLQPPMSLMKRIPRQWLKQVLISLYAILALSTGGSIGAETALKLEQCPSLVDQWAEGSTQVNQDIIILVHGGPVSMPDDAQFVLDNTQACHGFYGASSMERLPTEKALKEQTRAFKKLKFK
ncbi:MAG: hypothetical protein CM1200mP30_13430 [Pseudomonadota bacterium]|nr:MAG: hypothetical protein CM1200mP30_13430 [Pseudomonadota bacterium]